MSPTPKTHVLQKGYYHFMGEVEGYYYTAYDDEWIGAGSVLSPKGMIVGLKMTLPNGDGVNPWPSPQTFSATDDVFHINAIGIDGSAYEWLVNGTRPSAP